MEITYFGFALVSNGLILGGTAVELKRDKVFSSSCVGRNL